jgi:hypothetical protein
MHDLALRLASQGSAIRGKRLFMPHKEDSIPTNWLTLKDQTSTAQFVSIHTGQKPETCFLFLLKRGIIISGIH